MNKRIICSSYYPFQSVCVITADKETDPIRRKDVEILILYKIEQGLFQLTVLTSVELELEVASTANVALGCWKQSVFTDKKAIVIHFRVLAARTGAFPFSLDDRKAFLAANTQTSIFKNSLQTPALFS